MHQIFLSKRRKIGQKVISGPYNYISVVQKEPFIDIYLTGFSDWFFLERRKYNQGRKKEKTYLRWYQPCSHVSL